MHHAVGMVRTVSHICRRQHVLHGLRTGWLKLSAPVSFGTATMSATSSCSPPPPKTRNKFATRRTRLLHDRKHGGHLLLLRGQLNRHAVVQHLDAVRLVAAREDAR